MKITVISDIHLVGPGETSKGLDPAARLDLAIDYLSTHHADADLCVLLGDLADHGAEPAYRQLEERLARIHVPLKVLIGNHDDRDTFRRLFPLHATGPDGFVHSVLDTPEGRLVFLDTFEDGYASGRLCDKRLEWLAGRLAEAKGRPVYVFMHHPPFEIGMRVDAIGLNDAAQFRETLMAHGDVRQIIAGHTHRTCSGLWRGLPFTNVGALHYNQDFQQADHAGTLTRTMMPIAVAIVLIRGGNVVVHHQDVAPTRLPIPPQLFPEKRIEAIIARGGRIAEQGD